MDIRQFLDSNYYDNKYILRLILQEVFSFSKEQLYLNWHKEINENKLNKIREIYIKYVQENIPIEYLLWYTFFMWEKFMVNENTLIPRPETEYLVNYALEQLKEIYSGGLNLTLGSNIVIFDVWTWSGIIWINIAKHTDNLVICSDISKFALEIAKKNKENILWDKKNIVFLESNLLDFIDNGYKEIDEDLEICWTKEIKGSLRDNRDSETSSGWQISYETSSGWQNRVVYETSLELQNISLEWRKKTYIICANLPYVEKDFELDEYTKKEPASALFAGKDWLDLYRELLDQVIDMKNKRIILFFELMTKQAEALISEYKDLSFEILDTFHKNIKILKIIIEI